MKTFYRTILAVLTALPAIASAQSEAQTQDLQPQSQSKKETILPRWNIKTNLLYDATTTLNLGVEFRTGPKSSLDIPVSYNPWTFSDNRKWKHFLVQPEFRLWTRETFDGHFFGAHAHYAYYNVGNLPHSPFSEYMRDHRFEGWLAGVGVSYGYRWNFNRWLGLEATVGVGYAYMDYDKFECQNCGANLGPVTKHYFGPTKVGLSLIFGIGGKPASAPQPVPVIVPQPQPDPEPTPAPAPVVYEPTFSASFITPEAEEVKARSESGRAYLDFATGRSEIMADYKNNASELQKIDALIASVKNNPDATITGISITGHASPEGGAVSNQTLSERRAQALRNRIGATHDLPNNLFAVHGAGEDWATLESLVEGSSLPERGELLEAIRSGGDADIRERKLKAIAGGVPYRQLLTDCYPQLRRSDYSIGYTVAGFTVERSKEVFGTRPGDLSLNELFLIANTYPTGSEAFNEVFDTAARVFPDSDVANLNAAASALNRKDATSAARYLERVREQTAEYWNNLGLLQWLQGDKTSAARSFAKAGPLGTANAEELNRHLQSTTPR